MMKTPRQSRNRRMWTRMQQIVDEDDEDTQTEQKQKNVDKDAEEDTHVDKDDEEETRTGQKQNNVDKDDKEDTQTQQELQNADNNDEEETRTEQKQNNEDKEGQTGVTVLTDSSKTNEIASNPGPISLQCSGSSSSRCAGKLCTVLCSDGHKVQLHCEDEGVNVNSNLVGGLSHIQVSCGKKVQFRPCFPFCQGKQTLDTGDHQDQTGTKTEQKHQNVETGDQPSTNPFGGSFDNPNVNFNPFANFNQSANFNQFGNFNPLDI